jgi:hypothetical protein
LPARPPIRRGYATLTVALAAFLAAMVVLRVPFRGYLVEGRVAGCLDAAVSEADLRKFVQDSASGASTRIEVQKSGCCEVVFQQLALQAGDTQAAIDRAARRVAEQFVAQRREAARQVRLARYQAELRTARDAEDAQRLRLDQLRQQQLAEAGRQGPSAAQATGAASSAVRMDLLAQLQVLQSELMKKLATMTDEHPDVIRLRAQIAGIERQLSGLESDLAQRQAQRAADGTYWIATATADSELADQLDAAAADLMAATRARQWAERQLQSQVQALGASAATAWSIEPARITARVGGTPRMLTLLGASLVTLLSAALMYRASGTLLVPPPIRTADELVDLLALPLVGHTPASVSRAGRRWQQRAWSRARQLAVRMVLHTAELVLVAMVAALVFTMLADRALTSQVLGDPFGVLSEVADRVLSKP